MNFERTEQQQLLCNAFDRFARADYSFEERGRILASARGMSDRYWETFAEMGLLGLSIPPEYGGFGGGAEDLACVMETIGEALIVEPYLQTIGIGARLIVQAGSESMKTTILPAIAEGRMKLALAHLERGGRYDFASVDTRAERTARGWVLNGGKQLVVQAQNADRLVLSARVSGQEGDDNGIALFLVDTRTQGITMKTVRTIDGNRAADVVLRAVEVGDEALVCGPRQGEAVFQDAIDFATFLLAAEAIGAARSANEATVEYVKTRKQFGVPIGSFQAVQHRVVDMFIGLEQLRSLVYLTAARLDRQCDPAQRQRIVSALKIKTADVARLVSQESVQFHGGMGLTDELKISHTFRRLTVIAQEFGDVDYHLERYTLE
jgi:alkylation response protein AidB-like acyl-CoA dehydrogenase